MLQAVVLGLVALLGFDHDAPGDEGELMPPLVEASPGSAGLTGSSRFRPLRSAVPGAPAIRRGSR